MFVSFPKFACQAFDRGENDIFGVIHAIDIIADS